MPATRPSATAHSVPYVVVPAEMSSLSFCVLGSGSGGNCSVLIVDDSLFLIDAGLSIRQTRLRMESVGLSIHDVRGLFVTHMDRDHFGTSWPSHIQRMGLKVHVGPSHIDTACRFGVPDRSLEIVGEMPESHTGMMIHRIDVDHDQSGCSAFIFQHGGSRLGWATDLGHVPQHLLDAFVDLDAVAFESNYDRQMQEDSGRPAFLKERIMGGRGHLSNRESLEAIRIIDSASRLQHIVLLHLSRQCNCPRRVHDLWRHHGQSMAGRITVTDQHEPTALLRVKPVMNSLFTL